MQILMHFLVSVPCFSMMIAGPRGFVRAEIFLDYWRPIIDGGQTGAINQNYAKNVLIKNIEYVHNPQLYA